MLKITLFFGALLLVVALHTKFAQAETDTSKLKYRVTGLFPQFRVGRSGENVGSRWSDFLASLTSYGDSYGEFGRGKDKCRVTFFGFFVDAQPKRQSYRVRGLMPQFRVGRSGQGHADAKAWENYIDSLYPSPGDNSGKREI
jgi:hypothetical protein